MKLVDKTIQTQDYISTNILIKNLTLDDLKQAVINYLFKRFDSNILVNEEDIKLFEIIYKNK